MKIKLAMLLFIIPVFLVFHSCLDYSLPEKIDLEVEGSINLPVKIATSSWSSILIKTFKESFSGDIGSGIGKIEIYDVNYGQTQTVQAFCVYVPIEMSNSLNPGEYLEGIADLTKLDSMEAPLEIEQSIDVPSFDDFPINCPVESPDLDVSFEEDVDSFKIHTPIILSFRDFQDIDMDSLGDDFLHATIGEGSFEITLDLSEGDIFLVEDEFDFIYNVEIHQDLDDKSLGSSPIPYYGLAYTTSGTQSLKDQSINKNPVKINETTSGPAITLSPKNLTAGGTVKVRNHGGNKYLAGQLKIKMKITEFAEIDWNFSDISKGLKADPLSLASVAKVLDYIKFDSCYDENGKLYVDGNGVPKAGIGINVNFTEIIEGLAMSVNCEALGFYHETVDLHAGNNVFGNTGDLTLVLDDGYKNDVKKLQFEIDLLPSGNNKDVLHLTNLKVGDALKIKGEAKLFQHWTEAEVNLKEALNAAKVSSENFEGKFPNTAKGEKPVDLSMLNDYLSGFKFSGIQAAAYLNGPDNAINTLDPHLSIDAYNNGTKLSTIMDNELKLKEKGFDIKNYLDEKGSYKSGELPLSPNERIPIEIEDVLNAMPKNLVFQYNIKLPDTIIVTPDLFDSLNDENASSKIAATIILLIDLELTAGDTGGWITYPNMFGEGPRDLFGRAPDKNNPSKPEQDSMFTSLNVGYISFAVNFADAFFTGGKVFLEKENDDRSKLLFPDGISVDGRGIAINITNKEFDFIKNNFIIADFRLEFKEGGKITIPRNIGVTSVKIEAKGKNSLKLDF